MNIRFAHENEAEALTNLAFASKAYWGYDADFMEQCRAELTLTPADCRSDLIKVAEVDEGQLAGYYKLGGTAPNGELEHLFVAPDHIGRGIGKILLNEAIKHAKSLGFPLLEIDADPYAEGFYEKMGARRIGMVPSGSIPGRELPRLSLVVHD